MNASSSTSNLRMCIVVLRWLGIAATAGFLVSAFTPLWNVLGERLAVPPDLRPADAIVVLGSGVMPDGTLGDESMKRFIQGTLLYKKGFAPILVLSGPQNAAVPGKSEAEVRRDLALQIGIPGDRIIAISQVKTTREESIQVAAALAARHASTILLVTESLHVRRAQRVFERAGLKTFPAPSDDMSHASFSPNERVLLMWSVLEQGAGLLYYRLAGYI